MALQYRGDREVPEQLAPGDDLHLQIVFLDDKARPYGVEEVSLAEDPVAVLNQRMQHIGLEVVASKPDEQGTA
jgi:hypothetical protein